MPFTEQEVATSLQEVHSLLFQWTSSLWGEPIVLTDNLGNEEPGAATHPPHEVGQEALPTIPAGNSSDDADTVTGDSHRRRRLHALFDDS